jgi:hypothetical protein
LPAILPPISVTASAICLRQRFCSLPWSDIRHHGHNVKSEGNHESHPPSSKW